MTDLEKWKKFLDEMNIKYEQYDSYEYEDPKDADKNSIIPTVNIFIDQMHMDNTIYNPNIAITFKAEDMSFMFFNPSGE